MKKWENAEILELSFEMTAGPGGGPGRPGGPGAGGPGGGPGRPGAVGPSRPGPGGNIPVVTPPITDVTIPSCPSGDFS